MGELTSRGTVVAAGGNALAAGDDDTLTNDQNGDTKPAGATGASDTGDQVETVPAAEDNPDASAPAPAPKETAVDVVAGDRETRES